MGLPRTLKAFAAFVDGNSYAGEVPELTLPKLTRKTEEYRAGGMNGPVDIDFGNEKIEIEFTCAGWVPNISKTWGAATHDAVLLRFAGAVQADDSEAVAAAEVIVRGRLAEIDKGTAKAGEKSEHKYKMNCSYYREILDGETLIELDFVNMIENVGGTDRLSGVRAALGI